MTNPPCADLCDSRPAAGAVPRDSDRWAALALHLAGQDDRDAVLARVVTAALAHVGGAQHAGITVLGDARAFTSLASDDRAREIDHRQFVTDEGPGLSVATGQDPVIKVDDLETDARWPRFAAAVAHLEIRSVLSFRLYAATGGGLDTVGALNLYAAPPAAFSDDSVHTGILLASHAAIAVAAAERGTHLRTALQFRDVIGQAKGILMERFKITAEQAFDLLITASQRTNRKLHDVAESLTATGDLDAPNPGDPDPIANACG